MNPRNPLHPRTKTSQIISAPTNQTRNIRRFSIIAPFKRDIPRQAAWIIREPAAGPAGLECDGA